MKKTLKILVPLILAVFAFFYIWPKLFTDINDRRPAWSPDGRFLAFVSNRRLRGVSLFSKNRSENLWIIGVDGRDLRSLTPKGALTESILGSPQWSPDGRNLLVKSENLYWVVPTDGGQPVMLGDDVNDPRWSPDGKRILYTSIKDFKISNVWTVSANGSDPKLLTRMTRPDTGCFEAEWSPDGSEILFISARATNGSDTINEAGTDNLWIMAADGTKARAVTRFENPDEPLSAARWLPGGKEIFFHLPDREEGGYPELGHFRLLNVAEEGHQPLSRDLPVLSCIGAPKSSPDARKYLCVSFDSPLRKRAHKETLWLFDRETNTQRPLTQDVKEERSRDPDWSPDGRRIAFSRHTYSQWYGSQDRLWIMEADGRNPKALTSR